MINSISSATDPWLLWLMQIANQNQSQNSNFGNFIISQLNKDFSKIDTDGDGKITKAELKSFFTQMFKKQGQTGQTPNIDDLVNAIFSKLDPSKTGYIDKNALADVLKKMGDKLFAKIDTDGDGKISKDELKAFLAKMQKHHKHGKKDQASNIDDLVKQLFSKLDTNNDGSITNDEFTAALAQNSAAGSSLFDLFQGLTGNK